jgi:hypothetical protein
LSLAIKIAIITIYGGFFMRLMIGIRVVLLLNLLLCVHAVSAETEEDGRFWVNLNATGQLPAEGWSWFAELQPRWRHEGSDFDQLIIRPAVSYHLNKQTSLWVGYAHVVSHPDGKKSFEENRTWQQLLHNFEPIGSLSIQSRTRLEQRFIENSDDTGHKIRQMIRFTLPSTMSSKLHWVAYDEYFINFNDTDSGARSGFDQNRVFLGANWAFESDLKLEIGYLNQHVNAKNTDQSNHVLSSTINLSF